MSTSSATRTQAVRFMAEKAWEHRRLFVAPLICILLQRIAASISLYSTGWVAGSVLARDSEGLVLVFGLIFIVAKFRTVIHNTMWWYLIHNLSHTFWGRLKESILAQVTHREPEFFQRLSSEVISSRINDSSEIARLWRDALLNIVFDGFTFIVNLIILGFAAPLTVPAILVGVGIFFTLYAKHEISIAPLREEERNASERGNDNAVIRIIAAAQDLLANNALRLYAKPVKDSIWAFIKIADLLMWLGTNLRGMLRDFAASLTSLLVIVILSNAALKGEISGPEFISLLAITASLFEGLWAIAEFGKDFSSRLPTVARIVSLLNEPVVYPLPETPKQVSGAATIEFRNVTFTYPARTNGENKVIPAAAALRERYGFEVNAAVEEATLSIPYLKIAAGQTIALVGPSGGGKSTLIKLILGFIYPDSGEVLINGIPTTELGFVEISKIFGTISQAIQILDGSIAENVLLAAEPYSADQEDAVIETLRQTGFWDVVSQWDNNIYEQVGTRGTMLSGGQRQRLALARAFFKRPPNLVLDEATAALDMQSERQFGEAIAQVSPQGTKIISAHRLASITHADRILVISGGKIVEQGKHLELLSQTGVYYNLWNQGKVAD
jgi:ABC-type multidrug transport system fused ATPase/permease subunit